MPALFNFLKNKHVHKRKTKMGEKDNDLTNSLSLVVFDNSVLNCVLKNKFWNRLRIFCLSQ